MGKVLHVLLVLFISGSHISMAQSPDVNPDQITQKSSEELQLRLTCFENAVNDVLKGSTSRAQLDPFIIHSDDLDHWMKQFVFTEEVLKETSEEAFYNKLQGWADQARMNFLSAIDGIDRFVITDQMFRYSEDPSMVVSKTANLLIYLYKNEEYIGSLQMTMIDLRGQFKMIEAN